MVISKAAFFSLMLMVVGFLLSGLTISPISAASITLPEIDAARIDSNAEKTRFTAEMNFAVGYNVYVLTKPYRVVIDVPNAIFNMPAGTGNVSRGLIRGFRFGQLDDNRSRIVIDVTGPVLIQNSYAVRHKKNRPARLIIDLIATDPETFAKINQVDQVANLVAKEQAKGTNNKKFSQEDVPPVSRNKKLLDPIANLLTGNKRRAKKKTRSKAPSRNRKLVVVIDPGHGGIDTGASSKSGVHEKTLVLAFSKKLRDKLNALGRYKVILTRTGDKFLSLRKRVSIAHKNKADLFVAIHADSIRHSGVRGTTLYTLSEKASDKEAAALAAKENHSDIIGGVDLNGESKAITNILIDLAQRETKNHSLYFAKKAVRKLKRVTRMTKRPMRSAGFVVLKAPDVPSVLLELGYLSNRRDTKLLTSKRWQSKVAKALALAVDNYFRARIALQ